MNVTLCVSMLNFTNVMIISFNSTYNFITIFSLWSVRRGLKLNTHYV
jgi:hypothetical protein